MNDRPDYQNMTLQELRQYFLSHRDNDEAFYAYIDKVREKNDRVTYPPLTSVEDMEKYPEIIEQMRSHKPKDP